MSPKEIKKQCQIPGKGHNEMFEIINPLKNRRVAKAVIEEHVPENGGAHVSSTICGTKLHATHMNLLFDR
jgi:hypothetical protein